MNRFIRSMGLVFVVMMTGACSQSGGQGEPLLTDKLFKLAHMNGCIECHRISATVVGPSWQAIVDRYKGEDKAALRAMLIDSIAHGSRGKWYTWKGGDGMPAMQNRVSKEHIEQLVDYILLLSPAPSTEGK